MDIKGLERDLNSARLELSRIERQIAELIERRQLIERFVESAEALVAAGAEVSPSRRPVGTSLASSSASPPATSRQEDPSPGRSEGGRPDEVLRRPDGTVPLADRRRFWRRVTDEAIAIMVEEGRPMTAAEIHNRHGARSEVTSEEIYDTLYKRSSRGRLVRSLGGYFEPL